MSNATAPQWTRTPEYELLRKRVESLGLLKKTPYLYVTMFLVLVVIFGLFFFSLQYIQHPFLAAVIGLLMGFPLAWWGYLSHDISHGEVFSSKGVTNVFSTLVWPLSLGVSGRYWYEKHNAHHEFVNVVGADPDLDIPAFLSDVQRAEPSFIQKILPTWVIRHQHKYFFFLFPFLAMAFYANTIKRIFVPPYSSLDLFEIFLVTIHFVLFYGAIFWLLGVTNGILFSVINVMSAGLILSLAFAPNHKGEIMFPLGTKITWREQVIATRNLTPSLIVDFLYGGLNYQIEHHLFPYMSRFNLKKARAVIKSFCEEYGVPYHETTPFGSMKEIYLALKAHAR